MSIPKKEGYEMYLDVITIGSIKPVPSGTFADRDGKQIKYSGSVSFKVTNVETIEDAVLGLKEVDSSLIVKISCEHDSDIKPLNEYIRILEDRKQAFRIPITIPRQSDGSTFKTTCTLKSKEFILMMEKEIKKAEPKKQS